MEERGAERVGFAEVLHAVLGGVTASGVVEERRRGGGYALERSTDFAWWHGIALL